MPTRSLLRAVLLATCLAGAIASLVTYVSEVRLEKGVAMARDLRTCPRALPELEASDTALNPNTTRDLMRAACLVEAGRAREADRLMERTAKQQPDNAEVWVTLSRYQAARRRPAAARASYARARRLDPHLPLPRF